MGDKELHEAAIELGRKLIEKVPELREWVEKKLPELVESEDESIRKVLIGWVNLEPSESFNGGFSKEQILAWLEKQKGYKNAYIPKFRPDDIITSSINPEFIKYVIKDISLNELGELDYVVEDISDSLMSNGRTLRITAKKADEWGVLEKQKEAEWNDVDKCMLDLVVGILKKHFPTLGYCYTTTYGSFNVTIERVIEWINSLKPQKKQEIVEWSEEDEKMLSVIKEIAYTISETSDKQFLERHGTNSRELIKFALSNKSLHPQKQWKPSDEQMDALDDVISSKDIKYDILSELWKDLKKLKEG